MAAPTAPVTLAELTAARELLARAASAGIDTPTAADELAAVRDLHALHRLADALYTRQVATADASRAARSEGHDMSDVIAELETDSARECQVAVMRARGIAAVPKLLRAYAAGEINRTNLDQAEYTLSYLRSRLSAPAFASATTEVIDEARRLTPAFFKRRARQIRLRHDEEAARKHRANAAAAAQQAHEQRRLKVTTAGPALSISGQGSAQAAEAILAALNRRARIIRAKQINAGQQVTPLCARLFDALLALCTEDNAHYPTAASLLGAKVAPDARPDEMRELVLCADTTPFDLGRSARLADIRLRTLVLARDGGCLYPGCTEHRELCEIAHLVSWARGGETNLSNLAALCPHHHWVTEHEAYDPFHYSAIALPGGIPAIIPPLRIDPTQTPLIHERFDKHRRSLPPPLKDAG
ncbi:hypothetical protein BSZ39_08040 [Bowdeniella nasicola]|uniref:HNH nuclease domain-containing protein n=1 Tax=Bowdeniella nasicola TaxID=208480 RepID=A0A1Q5Q209_9ACTO|nr:HNH endonuclease signature motif containing protein [Bowdeniella nasicola]OKL53712.1 hypothetical protein BSZ39_08040 [Bowdeniella nasicola]